MTDRHPEVEIARLIQKRHGFAPGSNLLELVKQYAEVDYLPIPVDKVDGVSLHLKVSGRRPSIIVNSHIPETRAKFTLAHEFGHVVIPWHIGTIFSYTDSEKHTEGADMAYWEMEAEANRFAAELLMPRAWLNALIIEYQDPGVVAKLALDLCGTSMAAVTIALNNASPTGYLYAKTEANGIVKLFDVLAWHPDQAIQSRRPDRQLISPGRVFSLVRPGVQRLPPLDVPQS